MDVLDPQRQNQQILQPPANYFGPQDQVLSSAMEDQGHVAHQHEPQQLDLVLAHQQQPQATITLAQVEGGGVQIEMPISAIQQTEHLKE